MHRQSQPAQLCLFTHVPACLPVVGCNKQLSLRSPPGLASGGSKSSSSLSSRMVLRWTPAGQMSSLQAALDMKLECPASKLCYPYMKSTIHKNPTAQIEASSARSSKPFVVGVT